MLVVPITFVVLLSLTAFSTIWQGKTALDILCKDDRLECDTLKTAVFRINAVKTYCRGMILPLWDKSLNDWILDSIGLVVQGIIIPFFQVIVFFHLWRWFAPQYENCISLNQGHQFLLSFVAIDYLYYWNHRLLHSSRLWWMHQVHHSVTQMDVLGTSRNTLWSSFFIVYLWVHSLMLYVLDSPNAYGLGIALTAGLDLWRHSIFSPIQHSLIYKALGQWLMLPIDHAWHHSKIVSQCNYGANFKLWDRLHGTYVPKITYPRKLGIQISMTLRKKLLAPLPGSEQPIYREPKDSQNPRNCSDTNHPRCRGITSNDKDLFPE